LLLPANLLRFGVIESPCGTPKTVLVSNPGGFVRVVAQIPPDKLEVEVKHQD
jgi:hypothetical protein